LTPELNAVCPDVFEYYFVDEEFVVDRELHFRLKQLSNPYLMGEEKIVSFLLYIFLFGHAFALCIQRC
jgi:hypothetical protein